MNTDFLIIGGGIAGIQASLDLANRGFKVYLVEKSPSIGGRMAQLDKTFPTMDCAMCILAPKMIECSLHPNIKLLTYSEVKEVSGSIGNYTVKIQKKPRFIDGKKCTGCGDCVQPCPVTMLNEFDMNMGMRKAIYRPFPQAIPNVFTIDKEGIPPCRATCPAGVNVQGYVALISQGKFKEALELIRKDIPFPAVCGRVCFHPCEAECERGKVDEPLAIGALKRFIADYELGRKKKVKPLPIKHKEKIAVIGSGPAGLTTAYELVKKGYRVTVFESSPKPGGMLRTCIPKYRLPKNVLDAEIEYICDLGVKIKTDTPIGKDLNINDLFKVGYNAVFIAVGAQKSRKLCVEGEDLKGVMHAIDLLKKANIDKIIELGDKVGVIGGGNVAIDAARTALRLGCKDVNILYRRSKAEMPANPREVEEAEKEGIKLHFLVAPKKILGKAGSVVGIELIQMRLGKPDERGRCTPIPIEGSEFFMELNTAVIAVGESSDTSFLPKEIRTGKLDDITTDPVTLETTMNGVFAGGDVVSGPATVIDAIAAGKRAAVSIDRYLRGENLKTGREEKIENVKEVSKEGVEKRPRQVMRLLLLGQRVGNFKEVELGFTQDMAIEEAKRCLSCGGCSECRECEKVCKAEAVIHQQKEECVEIKVGAIIVATGLAIPDPSMVGEYKYGVYDNVITSMEFERLINASGPTGGKLLRPSDNKEAHRIAFIQCVGSRCQKGITPYCSSVCCMYATKEAILIKDHRPESEVCIFFMDLRVIGKGSQEFVNRAEKNWNVKYMRARPGEITEDIKTKDLTLWYEDTVSRKMEKFEADLVVLCPASVPRPDNVELAKVLGTDLDEYGFFKSPNPISAPIDATKPGIFMCGYCQGPKDIPESVTQASATVARAAEMINTTSKKGVITK